MGSRGADSLLQVFIRVEVAIPRNSALSVGDYSNSFLLYNKFLSFLTQQIYKILKKNKKSLDRYRGGGIIYLNFFSKEILL